MEYYLDKVKLKDKDILYRLLQYSLFEESLNDGNEMNENAIYEYKYFDLNFCDNNRDAYFIKDKIDDKLLGVVMINTYVRKFKNGHSIAEFMIIPKYRRKKLGERVAFDCFNMYKGNWEVSPSFGSETAYNFWNNVISKYTINSKKYEDRIFTFINK